MLLAVALSDRVTCVPLSTVRMVAPSGMPVPTAFIPAHSPVVDGIPETTAAPDEVFPVVVIFRRLAGVPPMSSRKAMPRPRRSGMLKCVPSTAPYFVPIHTQPHVVEALGTAEGDFPVTERIAARTIALPFFAGLTEQQVGRAKSALLEALEACS